MSALLKSAEVKLTFIFGQCPLTFFLLKSLCSVMLLLMHFVFHFTASVIYLPKVRLGLTGALLDCFTALALSLTLSGK